MPDWNPEKIWDNEEAFIIGGGKSLERFDWDLLRPELTVGCNDAFKLGTDICKICVFGDVKWFIKFQFELVQFKNPVFTNLSKINKLRLDWVWYMIRENHGLHHDALGWNWSTGAMAINLALLLGVKRVFLLGFDMFPTGGRCNWHDNQLDRFVSDKRELEKLAKFLSGLKNVAKDLNIKFPGTEIINITDRSGLNEFLKIGVKEFWNERKTEVAA